MRKYIIVLRVRPAVELFQKQRPLAVRNMKFKAGATAYDENEQYIYDFSNREEFHKAIDYLIDNNIPASEIKW